MNILWVLKYACSPHCLRYNGPYDAQSFLPILKYSQVADWKFTKCILGSRGKCAEHPDITAAAVMDDLMRYLYKICDHKGTRALQL